jgi:hypothetical protein
MRGVGPMRAACCLLPTGCCLVWTAAVTLGGVTLLVLALSHL